MQDCNVAVARTSVEITTIDRSPRPHHDEYATAIRRFDTFEEEQEQQVARRWQELGVRRAADALAIFGSLPR
ncbi:hypothetical protein [Bradyrhizobium sp. 61]|uniref:hypothetical protein n=1 Tax=Bradyrhizobium sp. 61 TaxID=2782679 RepID=UPI0031F7924F